MLKLQLCLFNFAMFAFFSLYSASWGEVENKEVLPTQEIPTKDYANIENKDIKTKDDYAKEWVSSIGFDSRPQVEREYLSLLIREVYTRRTMNRIMGLKGGHSVFALGYIKFRQNLDPKLKESIEKLNFNDKELIDLIRENLKKIDEEN